MNPMELTLVAAAVLLPMLLVCSLKTWFYLYIVALFTLPPFFQEWTFISSGLRVDQLLLAGIFLAALSRELIRGRIYTNEVCRIYVSYVAFCMLSVGVSHLFPGSHSDIVHTVKRSFLSEIITFQGFVRPLIVYMAFLWLFRVQVEARRIVFLIFTMGALATLFGLFQYLAVEPVTELTKTYYLRKSHWEELITYNRAVVSVFGGEPNAFATFFSLFVPLTLALIMFQRMRWTLRALLISLLFCELVVLFGTNSRGGFIGVAAAVSCFLVISARPRVYIGALILTLPVLFWASTEAIQMNLEQMTLLDWAISPLLRFEFTANYLEFTGRSYIWGEHLRRFFQSPLLGTGFNFYGAMDSLYLAEVAQRGLAGLALFFVLIGTVLKQAFALLRTSNKYSIEKVVATTVISATCGLLVNGISDYTFMQPRLMETYWIFAGCVSACVGNTRVIRIRELAIGKTAPSYG